jgi:hypothetical protein
MNLTQTASLKVLNLINSGMSPVDALKAVCGTENVDAMINTLYKELRMRGAAAAHLKGLPARHNQNAINGLYDRLTNLHIERIEKGES